MSELIKVDPKEYGLEENQAQTIEQAFLPKIQERDGYAAIYGSLITKEINLQTEKEARELRLKLVKVRTGIAEIHKTQKAFFLAAGRFVDAWKNKEIAPIEQMEENLSKIEMYSENIRREKIAKLEAERKELVMKFSEVVPIGLGTMDISVFDSYLTGLELAYNARIKAEQEAEAERLRLIEVEKENARLKAIEDERIRLENERLKAEAEKRERAIEAERKKQAELIAKERAEAEAKQRAIEEEARKAAALAEAERKRLQDEIAAKEAAEAAAKAEIDRKEKERIEDEKKAAKAPDKTKLLKWVNEVSMPELKLGTPEGIGVAQTIDEKFAAFKRWAQNLIETL